MSHTNISFKHSFSNHSRRDLFSATVRRLLRHSTLHGLDHITTAASKLGRTAWLILWVAGVVGFVVNLSLIVDRYMTRPVLISHVGDHEWFIWPDITICNPMAPYSVHLYNRTQKWQALREKATRVSTQIDSKLFKLIDEMDESEIAIQALMHSTLAPSEFGVGRPEEMISFLAADIGHRGILLTVELDGNLSTMSPPLDRYFHTQVLQKRYNVPCHTLQVAHGLPDNQSRHTEKIALGLKFNFDSYLTINSSYASPAMDLFISLPGEVPDKDPIELLPGYTHSIRVKMSRFRREPSKLPCRKDTYQVEVFGADLVSRHLVRGSASFCHRILSQRLYVNSCGCYSPFLPYPVLVEHPIFSKSAILCFNLSRFTIPELNWNANCMYTVYQRHQSANSYWNLPEAMDCDRFRAVPQCEDVQYQQLEIRRTAMMELWSQGRNEARAQFLVDSFESVFGHEVPRDAHGKALSTTGSLEAITDYLKKNLGIVSIHRTVELGELVREDLEYPLPELMSDIGGLLGLWIGISVVGLLEMIELFGVAIVTAISYLIDKFPSTNLRQSTTSSKEDCFEPNEIRVTGRKKLLSTPRTNPLLLRTHTKAKPVLWPNISECSVSCDYQNNRSHKQRNYVSSNLPDEQSVPSNTATKKQRSVNFMFVPNKCNRIGNTAAKTGVFAMSNSRLHRRAYSACDIRTERGG